MGGCDGFVHEGDVAEARLPGNGFEHHLRPRNAKVAAQFAKDFPKVQTFTVDQVFGGWKKAQADHFNDGGLYDQVIAKAKRR